VRHSSLQSNSARRSQIGSSALVRWFLAAGMFAASGCTTRTEDRVVVYTAAKQESVQPILDAFERETDGEVRVVAKFDVRPAEAMASLDGSGNSDAPPPCDLYWDNEVLPTIRLQKQGRLQRNALRVPRSWPAKLSASDGAWCGFAARARILLVNRDALEPEEELPRSVEELADPRWKGRCGMADPLRGTSATHWTVLREHWGAEATLAMLTEIRENAVVMADERQLARAVSAGQLAWGLTDSDLAMMERDRDYPVEIVFPDQAPDRPGTLRIPSTVAIVRGAAHPGAAGQLAAFLLTPEIEDRLAMGAGSLIPIHRESKFPPAVLPSEPIRWMRADFEAAGDLSEAWAERLRSELGEWIGGGEQR
jgi:iron(III) transport system substrate-binding protein